MESLSSRLAGLFGREHAVLFGRARSGLLAAVAEWGGAGTPVLMPSNVCPAVLAAVVGGGGTPQLVAVSPQSGLADDDRLVAAMAANPAPRGIVMPTHLYGAWSDYAATCRLAAERGWAVLENDSLAALPLAGEGVAAIGDAVLVSFGAGKTIDAGGGGALLTDDARFAEALARRAQAWPAVTEADERVETETTLARRALRALGKAALAEELLTIDLAHLGFAFADAQRERLTGALEGFREAAARRRDCMDAWRRALAGLDDRLTVMVTAAPWRLVLRLRDGWRRDEVAAVLRRGGIDVGINFPPLTDGYPKLLAGQRHADADEWGGAVLNLWLSEDYDDRRIGAAAAILARALDSERP